MKLKLDGVKSCYVPDLSLKLVRGQEFEVTDEIGASLLAQGEMFKEIKTKKGSE